MSENITTKQRQTPTTFSGIGNMNLPTGNPTGLNRSRRSSWSDAKVKYFQ
jgi:hypothetical protein